MPTFKELHRTAILTSIDVVSAVRQDHLTLA
ncbi:TIGR03086 family protein, partial [Mycobacterium sp. ITM-2017-0098]